MVSELDLDRLFWGVISTDADFRRWVVGKTKFAHLNLELVTAEKWHQRWYRDPVTKRDSETDILLMFTEVGSGERYAIHIENKPDHRRWEPLQFENYRKRALDRREKWKYVDFQTALLASCGFIERHPNEAGHFDIRLTYEEVSKFVPAFSVDMGEIDTSEE